ncbi:hypothetical protein TNCT_58201 [Trichonephila clavata]|uniref:Uncharacterized protein n=1 Tax=Trichonephila clavata TaxID=2740835 RepID=A0A8X6EY71_TRICU|nr:hypothetical protein TNCT_58201 [Trichonephila clavata]
MNVLAMMKEEAKKALSIVLCSGTSRKVEKWDQIVRFPVSHDLVEIESSSVFEQIEASILRALTWISNRKFQS